MAKFTLLETVVYHRMLWAELADTGNGKHDANFWEQNKINHNELIDCCFPCDYSKQNCEDCVFDFPKNCYNDDGYFQKWNWSVRAETPKKYAALIRDLPLKPKYAEMLGEL